MSEICPICGCKTDQIDFVSMQTEDGLAISVCDYCNKQISSLKSADISDAEGLTRIQPKVRWLDAALAKQVEDRDAGCTRMLASLRNRFPNYLSEQWVPDSPAQHSAPPAFVQSPAAPTGIGMAFSNSTSKDNPAQTAGNAEIEALRKRLEKLETSFYKMKRTLMITNVIEFVVPAFIMIILAIIFFRSELWTNLSRLIYEATGGYNVF